LPGEVLLDQGRAVIGSVRLVADQDQVTIEPEVTQRARRGQTGRGGTDDRDRVQAGCSFSPR
jgi:hypothetical protein